MRSSAGVMPVDVSAGGHGPRTSHPGRVVRRRGMVTKMDSVDQEQLAAAFEEQRTHLRAVAYRMLGSVHEADDAVQEGWLRLSRSDVSEVENLAAWLTTVVSRICLDQLRSRGSRREDALPEHDADADLADAEADPVHDAILADQVGSALQVVLDTLSPAERLAFVLHDLFAVPFDEVGPVMGRSSAAVRQLASRARRRVQSGDDEETTAPAERRTQREVVEAFLTASRDGRPAGTGGAPRPGRGRTRGRHRGGAGRAAPGQRVRGGRADLQGPRQGGPARRHRRLRRPDTDAAGQAHDRVRVRAHRREDQRDRADRGPGGAGHARRVPARRGQQDQRVHPAR